MVGGMGVLLSVGVGVMVGLEVGVAVVASVGFGLGKGEGIEEFAVLFFKATKLKTITRRAVRMGQRRFR